MFIGNGIDHRMIDTVKLTAVFTITGAMIRAADDKRTAPPFFPLRKQPAQFSVHIPKCRPMACRAVMGCPVQIKIVGVMDGVHIYIQENMLDRKSVV